MQRWTADLSALAMMLRSVSRDDTDAFDEFRF